MLAPAQMIDRLLTVPYARDRGDFTGADCWGVVELWYRHVLGIVLADRQDHPSSHAGLQAGFDGKTDWLPVSEPADHALVVMRAGRLNAGHIGVYFGGSVLHTDEAHGCVFERFNSPMLRSKRTGIFRHKRS